LKLEYQTGSKDSIGPLATPHWQRFHDVVVVVQYRTVTPCFIYLEGWNVELPQSGLD